MAGTGDSRDTINLHNLDNDGSTVLALTAPQPSSWLWSFVWQHVLAAIRPPLTALWGLLAWYLYVVVRHGESLPWHAWLSSVIIATIVGCVLNLNGTCVATTELRMC